MRTHPHSHDSPFREPGFWAAVSFGTLLSTLITGYVFPINNNLFHLVILGDLFNEPQFAADPFVQSMRHFAAGPWLLLRGAGAWVEPYWLLLALFVGSRLLSFLGFAACAHLLGVRGVPRQLLFAVLVATTSLMLGVSYAGEGGLFIQYFTQSEICNGLFLLTIYAALRGRLTATLALAGATFFVNAFFGVWSGAVAVVVFGYAIRQRNIAWTKLLVPGLLGVLAAAALAAPALVNLLENPEFGRPLAFDYIRYLREYYPFHFLFGSTEDPERLALVLVTFIGLAALRLGWRHDHGFTAAMLASIAIYMAGIVAPFVTHSPAVLNLHLLRSGVLIHALAALACCALVTRWWFEGDALHACVIAPLLAMTMAVPIARGLPRDLSIGVTAVILGGALAWRLPWLVSYARVDRVVVGRAVRALAFAWLAGAVSFGIFDSYRSRQPIDAWNAEWRGIAEWARASTNADAVFALPIVTGESSREADVGAQYTTAFEYLSHRRVWVDRKRGAAVMWAPSYYAVWRTRLDEVSALEGLDEKLTYARTRGIGYVIETSVSGCEAPVAFRTARVCVYAAASLKSSPSPKTSPG